MRGVYFSALLLLAATSAAETFNDNDIIPLENIYLARHEDADSTAEDYASGSPLDQADGLHYDGAHYDDIWITEDEDACPRHQAGKMCDIMISGVDQVADKSAQIDGKYVFDGCHQGRPKYRRQGRDLRWLWFSKPYRDWEIGASEASENSILMYGGLGSGELRPEHVHHTLWHLRKTLSSKPWVEGGRGFVRITVRIECVSDSTAAWQRLKAAAWQRLRG